jgi:hypothetical protein
VNLNRTGRECIQPTGDAVIEARSNTNHHIAIVHRHVGFECPMHAEHADPLRISRRERAETHQRGRDRIAGELHELAQEIARGLAGIDDAATGVEQWALGVRHEVDRLLDLVHVALEPGLVAGVREILRFGIDTLRKLDVFRHVDDNRARAAARGNVKCFVQDTRQILDTFDEIVVLRARTGDTDRVAFLKSVIADQVRRHLSCDADDRN